ncbi:MAG: type I restriction enzyme HsdR N-terminal domain-containing protein [Bacteroidales bacterium]|nr:type I restriction enzyme HsdR N-terminal domain-containing protein [Bacteroidales bacterium]MBN2818465.1 type I restriction enzyme HsdR N-terminal domain-containing protein [Bacteroidales bacterium]
MQQLNLPTYEFKWKKTGDGLCIFDELRKKFLVLTPEEWVRQNLVRYLVEDKNFPGGMISLEAGLKLNKLQKRYDVLVYSKQGTPLVLIECKAPSVKITQKVFEQILAYNITIKAPHLIVSNGLSHFFLSKNKAETFEFQKEIPEYKEISQQSA